MPDSHDYKVKFTTMRLAELHTADYNPRKNVHDDPVFYERLYKSISKFQYIDPIIVNIRDGKNIIVGGNQRYTVLCDMAEDAGVPLEQANVDVVIVDFDEDEEMAANIALNRIEGDWVQDKLKEDLEMIRSMDEDLAVAAGFSIEELDKMIAQIKEPEEVMVKDFKIHISLPLEYENYYDFYMNTHSDEDFRKEIIKIIVGAGNGQKENKR
jgi:ParB-like chromosome segregation protein Spo0J